MLKSSYSVIVICLFLSACAGPSRLAMDYGTSCQLAKFNQMANPDAQKNLTPVTGMDGRAAQITMEKYWKSFEGVPPITNYTISLGNMGRR